MSIAITLHLLAAVIWVGGMFFAYNVLRPTAVEILEPPLRLRLWATIFRKFFPWIWLSIFIILLSGFWMMFSISKVPAYILVMALIGIMMILIFLYVFFSPYQSLKKAVSKENWSEGGEALGKIRILVGINTFLGLFTIIIATVGKLLLTI